MHPAPPLRTAAHRSLQPALAAPRPAPAPPCTTPISCTPAAHNYFFSRFVLLTITLQNNLAAELGAAALSKLRALPALAGADPALLRFEQLDISDAASVQVSDWPKSDKSNAGSSKGSNRVVKQGDWRPKSDNSRLQNAIAQGVASSAACCYARHACKNLSQPTNRRSNTALPRGAGAAARHQRPLPATDAACSSNPTQAFKGRLAALAPQGVTVLVNNAGFAYKGEVLGLAACRSTRGALGAMHTNKHMSTQLHNVFGADGADATPIMAAQNHKTHTVADRTYAIHDRRCIWRRRG